MKDIAREMGVRTDVPFKDLTEKERDIVFHGPAVKKNIIYQNKTSGAAGDMDFTYFNATYTVENALSKVKDEKGMKRVEKFLRQGICPDCGGTRLSEAARAPKLRGISLAEACKNDPLRSFAVGCRLCRNHCRTRCAQWRKVSATLSKGPQNV